MGEDSKQVPAGVTMDKNDIRVPEKPPERVNVLNYVKLAFIFILLSNYPSASIILLGSLQTSTGTWHKIYMSDEDVLPRAAEHGTAYDALGNYYRFADHSPGYIVISKQDIKTMAGILAHEMCHAEQDDRRMAFDERECGKRWHPSTTTV